MSQIRPATAQDAADVASLCGQLGYPCTQSQALERIEHIRGQAALALLVVELDAQVAGLMQVSRHFAIESGAWAEIDALVVHESHRNAGLGRLLVAEACRWARANGLSRLRVRTNELRTRTHRFYEREGFMLKKSQRVYDRGV